MTLPSDNTYQAFLDELIAAGLLIPSGVLGIYGRSGTFEHIIDQFEHYVTRMGADQNPEVMRFPPIFNRAHYLKIDHIRNFPDLMGSVHSFTCGGCEHTEMIRKLENGEDWTEELSPTESMMIPAACYPLYPTAANTTLPPEGRTVDLKAFVFRHEPSVDPARMQIFRQREYVRMGTAEQALEHRNYWVQRGKEMLESVGLNVTAVLADDPFFGRGAKIMKATQREQDLKYELVVPICSHEKPTAVTSSNYHLDNFGNKFSITAADGKPAHTACVGFGLERIALALLKAHGLDPRAWPQAVRKTLALD